MLGLGEPCAKKSKIEQQRIYNERRKEKPRKPQFSLNFQFDFGEKIVMKETQDRFVRLRNMAENLRPGHTNADFLTALLDAYEGNGSRNAQTNQELHSVSVNDQNRRKGDRLSGQALRRSSFLQTALVSCGCEREFLRLWTGQFGRPSTGDCPRLPMWLVILFRRGQQCEKHGWSCPTFGIFLQERPQNKVGKFVNSWQQVHCKLQVRDFHILP